jgi:hypothetical protein
MAPFFDSLLRRIASNIQRVISGKGMKKKATSKQVILSEEQFQAIARVLGDARRLAMVEQIAGSEGMECSALHVHEFISPATVSHHMKELAGRNKTFGTGCKSFFVQAGVRGIRQSSCFSLVSSFFSY